MPSNRITPGGTAITARTVGLSTWPVATATSGTDTTVVAGTIYYGSINIPGDVFVTGVAFLPGSASTNGNVIAALYDEAGVPLANSALAGTTTTTAAQTQSVPLTVPFNLTGPRTLIVALQFSSTSDHLRTVPAYCGGGILAGSLTGVFGTLPNPLTISATNFTANTSPVAYLY